MMAADLPEHMLVTRPANSGRKEGPGTFLEKRLSLRHDLAVPSKG